MAHGRDLPLEAIVGRDAEVNELLRLLPSVRLVTVTALGGTGKTRLAREVATRWEASGRVACWIDLAALADADQASARIVEALPPESPADDEDQAIAGAIDGRPVLLVLDNAEHLPPLGARLAGWLRAAPTACALVTSRIPLRAPGERRFPLAPLRDDAAATLFGREVERLGGAVTERDRDDVASICTLLGGSPLALELAAAQAAVLGIAQTAQRLATTEAAPGIDAVVAWTLTALREEDRDKALLLGAVGGLLDTDLLEQLWGVPDAAPIAARLSDVGLLRPMGAGALAVLAPVRESLAARLPLSSRREALARCRAYLLRSADPFQPRYGEIARRRDLVDAVLRDVEVTGADEAAATLWPLTRALERAGLVRELDYWARRIVGSPAVSSLSRAQMLTAMAIATNEVSGPGPAIPAARAAVEASQGWPSVMPLAAASLARALDAAGDLDGASFALESALNAAREQHDVLTEVAVLGDIGMHRWMLGDHEAAHATLREVEALARSVGDPFSQAMALGNLAFLPRLFGPEQVANAREAWRILISLGPSTYAAWAATLLSWVLAGAGRLDEARAHAIATLDLVLDYGGEGEASDLAQAAARLAISCGRVVAGARLLGAASAIRERTGWALEPDERAAGSIFGEAIERLGAASFERHAAEGAGWTRDELVTAVRAELVPPGDPAPVDARYGRLSAREREVLEIVAQGGTDPDIARALGISAKTASVHVANLKTKTGADTRIELAMLGRELLGRATRH